jgi:hypothetical protein
VAQETHEDLSELIGVFSDVNLKKVKKKLAILKFKR